jgi:hypothetical protein
MKWWYVLVLIVGIVIGWWVIEVYKVTKVPVNKDGDIGDMGRGLPTQMVSDVDGKKVSSVQITGIVKSWDPNTGMVQYVKDNKLLELTINPAQTTVYVPSIKNKKQILIAKDRNSLRWRTAFCGGDFVSFFLAGDKVVMASNNGYRSCGYQGE